MVLPESDCIVDADAGMVILGKAGSVETLKQTGVPKCSVGKCPLQYEEGWISPVKYSFRKN